MSAVLEEPEVEEIPLDVLARAYIKIRETVQMKTRAHEEEISILEAQKDEIEAVMRDRLKAIKAESVNTKHGTIIMQVKTRYFPQDWAAFRNFVKENDAFELLEKRVAQGNLKKFIEENPDNVPPGLNVDSSYEVTVRKPRG